LLGFTAEIITPNSMILIGCWRSPNEKEKRMGTEPLLRTAIAAKEEETTTKRAYAW
jgi:hypothetical protein